MGVVWKAVDTALDRDVAIKFLPDSLTASGERLARFEREAKVLASLNHPAIAAVYGLHEAHGVRFLAMEHVPGEDLAQRLGRGPLPVEDAIGIGRQIAEGLEAAHDTGVVHRDLKPANIVVRPDGGIKILDFGLAKALSPDPGSGSPDPSLAPTLTSAGTLAGVILGTAAYMSPEQARGRQVDRRADIWALGCVLYELLTARRLFGGETVSDTLAAVLRAEIDLPGLPNETPPAVRRLIERCLDRDPHMRLRDAGEARIVLAAPHAAATDSAQPAARGRFAWAAVAALALVGGLASGRYLIAPPAPPPRSGVAFEVDVPGERIETGSIALSPDGTNLALLVRGADGRPELWVRPLEGFESRPLPGTQDASYPFWSPDGTEIGFFVGDHLLRVALDSTAPRRIASAPDAVGGTWNAEGAILFGTGGGPIFRVLASGGATPVAVTALETGVETAHVWPSFLPDGQRFVFLADASTDDGHRVYLTSLGSGPEKILLRAIRSAPAIDPAGALLLVQQNQLVAHSFDFRREMLTGASILVADGVYPLGVHHDSPYTLSSNGVVAYQQGSDASDLVRIDLDGGARIQLAKPDRYGNPALSPDGRSVAFELHGSHEERLIWVHDLERGVRTVVSHRGALADSAAWSAHGEAVYFDANPDGSWQVYRKQVNGGGDPELLGRPTEQENDVGVLDLSRDGRWLLVTTQGGGAGAGDLYLRLLVGAETVWFPWAVGPAGEGNGCFSPDSRWIAYVSDGSGRSEVYVAPVDGGPAASRWQISSGGGLEVAWSPDGKRIYYRAPTGELMRVPIRASAERIEAGVPTPLFELNTPEVSYVRNTFTVTPDGTSLIVIQAADKRQRTVRVRTSWR